MTRFSSLSPIAFAALALTLPGAAFAQDGAVANPSATPVAATAPAPFAGGAVLDDRSLGAVAGREDVAQLAQADQVAGVSRNSVGDNSQTGDARVSDNAFQNLSGLSILNVNTGNNVAINAAMNVNISINPAQ